MGEKDLRGRKDCGTTVRFDANCSTEIRDKNLPQPATMQ